MTLVNSVIMNFDKPNRVSDKKDEEYHVRYGKFALGNANTGNYARFLNKTKINRGFYKGGDNQWLPEDIESFLKDDTNQSRNRIKITNNVVRPLVEQFRGNANRMTINASLKPNSGRSIDRRERALAEQMFRFQTAFDYPAFYDVMKEQFNIGRSSEETRQIFFNHYKDEYAYAMNKLMDHIESENKLQNFQMPAAEDLALSGLAVLEGYHKAGKLVIEKVEVDEFFFDPSARKADLTDADYMGRASFMSPTSIYEMYNPKREDIDSIERYITLNSGMNPSAPNGYISTDTSSVSRGGIKVPVYKTYWKDMVKEEWGYVQSKFGITKLVKINWKGFNNDQEPEYTDNDLIDPPNTEIARKIFKGSKKKSVYSEVLRYCHFIPSDLLMTVEPYHSKRKVSDIVLDYGIYDYQQSTLSNPSKVSFPFKCTTWGYIDGEILSPVDDVISPQRFINRVLSASEGIINMSGGEGPILDADSFTPQEMMDGSIQRDMKQGKPIFMRTRGKGIPNSVGKYDTTPGAGAYQMMQLIPIMREIIQSSTGVNEPLQGQSSGSEQLVGVTEILVERGSLMQEPFYKAIEHLFIQVYEMFATVGKAIYIENEESLIVATGDESAEVINLSKDMMNEDFALFVKRDNSDEKLVSIANQQLVQFMEMGLIDDTIFANLYNRSKPDDLARAIRQFSLAKTMAAQAQAEQEQMMAEEEALAQDANLVMAEQEQNRMEARNDAKDQAQMANEKEKEIEKAALEALKNQGSK